MEHYKSIYLLTYLLACVFAMMSVTVNGKTVTVFIIQFSEQVDYGSWITPRGSTLQYGAG